MGARLRFFQFGLMTALFGCARVAHAQVEEDTLKAAFIYNFALYTTWEAPLRDATTLTICVQRTSPLTPALRALSGKAVQQRILVVNELDSDKSHASCDVRVAQSPSTSMGNEPGVLTVCDCDEDQRTGGAVVLLVRDGTRLRFDIDVTAASASGLTLSSKVLHLARTIR